MPCFEKIPSRSPSLETRFPSSSSENSPASLKGSEATSNRPVLVQTEVCETIESAAEAGVALFEADLANRLNEIQRFIHLEVGRLVYDPGIDGQGEGGCLAEIETGEDGCHLASPNHLFRRSQSFLEERSASRETPPYHANKSALAYLAKTNSTNNMKNHVQQALAMSAETFYYEDGVLRTIVTSPIFENLTKVVVGLNAVWIAVEVDCRPMDEGSDVIMFVIVNNIFCFLFWAELCLKFAAYSNKFSAFKDPWFMFDAVIVIHMVVETWIVEVVHRFEADHDDKDENGNSSSVLRLLRVFRVTRMGKLIHSVPEINIMMKGLASGVRSVIITMIMMGCITYMFAISFRQLAPNVWMDNVNVFSSVPHAIYVLLVESMMPDNKDMLEAVGLDGDWKMGGLFFLYLFFSSLTFMNMLIGVICDAMFDASRKNKEDADRLIMSSELWHIYVKIDKDFDGKIFQHEMEEVLENDQALRLLRRMGVDVFALVDECPVIYEALEAESLSFDDFVDVIWQFRPSIESAMRSIATLRRATQMNITQVLDKMEFVDMSVRELSAYFGEGQTVRKNICRASPLQSAPASVTVDHRGG